MSKDTQLYLINVDADRVPPVYSSVRFNERRAEEWDRLYYARLREQKQMSMSHTSFVSAPPSQTEMWREIESGLRPRPKPSGMMWHQPIPDVSEPKKAVVQALQSVADDLLYDFMDPVILEYRTQFDPTFKDELARGDWD